MLRHGERLRALRRIGRLLVYRVVPLGEVANHAHLKADGHINADYIKRFHLNKNDTAVGRIKHIPFIQRDEKDDKEPWMIYEKTASPDFAGDVILGMPSKYAIEGLLELFDGWQEACDGIPEHVHVLGTQASRAGRDGHTTFVDTARGTVVLADWQVGEKPAELLQRDAPDEESWRRYETYTKPGFFSMVKQQWRSGRLTTLFKRSVERRESLRKTMIGRAV
ncbi:hypothetical protein Ct61P_03385 [Colletotrichum tofieldiae]|nr:hypothetical protein Ct61P_03385 [Colletotrichum tofieldiae]